MKKSKKSGTKMKKHLSKVTTDDFFNQDFENNSDDDDKGENI